MAARSGEEGRSANARQPAGPGDSRALGRLDFPETADSGTGTGPGHPGRVPRVREEARLAAAEDGRACQSPVARIGRLTNSRYATAASRLTKALNSRA